MEVCKYPIVWLFYAVAPNQEKPMLVLGVTGGIACYKAVELVRLLIKDGFTVQVIMTVGAREFVTPLTFQTLSGNPVATETFNLTQESEIGISIWRIRPISLSSPPQP